MDDPPLRAAVEAGGPSVIDTSGVVYNPLTAEWLVAHDTAVNYMMVAVQPSAHP